VTVQSTAVVYTFTVSVKLYSSMESSMKMNRRVLDSIESIESTQSSPTLSCSSSGIHVAPVLWMFGCDFLTTNLHKHWKRVRRMPQKPVHAPDPRQVETVNKTW